MTQLLEDLAVWPELGLHCSNGSLGQVVTVRREEFESLKLRLPAKMGGHLTLSRSYTTEVRDLAWARFLALLTMPSVAPSIQVLGYEMLVPDGVDAGTICNIILGMLRSLSDLNQSSIIGRRVTMEDVVSKLCQEFDTNPNSPRLTD